MAFQRLAQKTHWLELEVCLLAGCAHKKKEEPFGFSFFLYWFWTALPSG
jgi:hypothetical protein